MAEGNTYDTLTSDLRRYLDRGGVKDEEVYAQIPRFVMMGQLRLTKEAPKLISTNTVTTTLTVGNPILAKPARWRETLSFRIGTGAGFNTVKTVYFRTLEYVRMRYPNPTALDVTKWPEMYADYDPKYWLLGPTPALAFPIEVSIIEDAVQLDDANQQNIYTQKAPDLLLHACLLEAALFVRNDTLRNLVQPHYDRLVMDYAAENKDQKTDASADNGVRK